KFIDCMETEQEEEVGNTGRPRRRLTETRKASGGMTVHAVLRGGNCGDPGIRVGDRRGREDYETQQSEKSAVPFYEDGFDGSEDGKTSHSRTSRSLRAPPWGCVEKELEWQARNCTGRGRDLSLTHWTKKQRRKKKNKKKKRRSAT